MLADYVQFNRCDHIDFREIIRNQIESFDFVLYLSKFFVERDKFDRIETSGILEGVPQFVLELPKEQLDFAFKIWSSSYLFDLDKKLQFKDLWFICSKILPYIKGKDDYYFIQKVFGQLYEISELENKTLFESMEQYENLLPNIVNLKGVLDLTQWRCEKNLISMYQDLKDPFSKHSPRWLFQYHNRYLINLIPYQYLMSIELKEVPLDYEERLSLLDNEDIFIYAPQAIYNTWYRKLDNPPRVIYTRQPPKHYIPMKNNFLKKFLNGMPTIKQY